MYKPLIPLVGALWLHSGVAATVTVEVREKGTGDALEGATVVLGNAGTSETTDSGGQAIFADVALPEQLKVLNAGYETWQQTLRAPKLTLFLTPVAVEGVGLEVIEERIREKLSKVVLPADEIKRTPGTQGDPLNVIQTLPGVVTPDNGIAASTGFYVRGSDSNENIVWVDRARIANLYHIGGVYSTINPALLSDFNIFLGGFPVEYDDVLGGALDVRLRSPRKDRLRQHYSLGYYLSSVFLEGPVGKRNGKNGFFLAARRSYIDLVVSENFVNDTFFSDDAKTDDEQNRIVQFPWFYDLQAVWEVESTIGRFSTQYFMSGDTLEAIFNSRKNIDPESAGSFSLHSRFNTLSSNWQNNWRENLDHDLNISLFRNSNALKVGTDITTGKPLYFNIETTQLRVHPELHWRPDRRSELSLGSQAVYSIIPIEARAPRPRDESDIGFDVTGSTKFAIDQTFRSGTLASYVKYFLRWTERLNTTAGLRYSYSRASGGVELAGWLPRFSVEYEIVKNTYLTGAWGQYVQEPQGHEWAPGAGNPTLTYTQAEHRIIGIKYKPDKIWSLQFETYHKPMRMLVVPIDDAAPPGNYDNTGSGEAYGFDALIKRDLQNGKMGWLSYSFLHTERDDGDGRRPFDGDQPHTLTAVWSQSLPGSWHHWNIGVRLRYQSGKPNTPIVGTAQETIDGATRTIAVYDKKNSARLPDFYQLDLRIDRRFLFNTWKMNLYADLLNVLGIKNVTGYDYGDNLEKVNNPTEQTSMGLFPSIGIEAEF